MKGYRYKIELEVKMKNELDLKLTDIRELLMKIFDTDEHNLFNGFIEKEEIQEIK